MQQPLTRLGKMLPELLSDVHAVVKAPGGEQPRKKLVSLFCGTKSHKSSLLNSRPKVLLKQNAMLELLRLLSSPHPLQLSSLP